MPVERRRPARPDRARRRPDVTATARPPTAAAPPRTSAFRARPDRSTAGSSAISAARQRCFVLRHLRLDRAGDAMDQQAARAAARPDHGARCARPRARRRRWRARGRPAADPGCDTRGNASRARAGSAGAKSIRAAGLGAAGRCAVALARPNQMLPQLTRLRTAKRIMASRSASSQEIKSSGEIETYSCSSWSPVAKSLRTSNDPMSETVRSASRPPAGETRS